MRCYALEEHYITECPLPKEYKICSRCSNVGHVWHQCQDLSEKCINCGGDHNALAMRCNKRKEILKEKRKQMNEKQNLTYASISQVTPKVTMPNMKFPSITKEEILKIHICIAHAQGKDQKKPGTYKTELDKVLKANNLPTIIIPDDSDEITECTYDQAADVAGATKVKNSEVKETQPTPGKSTEKDIFDATDLGIEIYTHTEQGWPVNFTTEELVKGIENKRYKWKYNNASLSEDQILRKISKGEIKLHKCFYAVDKAEFRKTRSGLIQDRSPADARDPRTIKKAFHSSIN